MIQTIIVYSLLILFMFVMMTSAYRTSPYNISKQVLRSDKFTYYICFLLSVLAFSIIFGMRYDVGVDHLHYLEDYIYGTDRNYEIIYVILNNACALCNMSYPFFFSLLSFLLVFLFLVAFKKEPYLFPFLVFFLFVCLIDDWNNIIRASLAFCVWVYSLDFIVEKKIIRYCLCVAIAMGFHTSAIILIVAYPLLKSGKKYFNNVPIQYFLIAAAFVVRFFFDKFSYKFESIINLFTVFTGSYEGYTIDKLLNVSVAENSGSGIAFIADLVVNLVVIAMGPKVTTFYNSKKFNLIYNLYFVGLLLLYIFPEGFISLTRPFRYFYMIRPIMLAYFTCYLMKSGKRLEMSLFIFLFIGIFYSFIIVSDKNSHRLYQTYKDHPEMPLYPRYQPKSLFVN